MTGEKIRFSFFQRTRPVRSVLRAVVVLALFYFLFPGTWFHNIEYHHDPTFEHDLHSKRKPRIQFDFPQDAGADVERLRIVKDEFLHAYHGYKSRAWLKDELKPISGGSQTIYCGWAATLIDTLDTLYIMGLYDEFDEAVKAVLSLNFGYAPSITCSINPFEMTIRHLGGLISAYDISGSTDERLKQKAIDMGEMLFQSYARNGIQCRSIYWPRVSGYPCEPNDGLSMARLGTQSLELIRLSMISGIARFERKSAFLAQEMRRLQSIANVPGLWSIWQDGSCPDGVCNTKEKVQFYSMGSASDSAYEYLPKTHLLYGARDSIYGEMWKKASIKIREHMLFQPMAPNNLNLLLPGVLTATAQQQNGKIVQDLRLEGKSEHLTCFVGGMFALSAKMHNDLEELDVAAKVTNGCVWAYESTTLGIAPDSFLTLVCKKSPLDCAWDGQEFAKARKSQVGKKLPEAFLDIEEGAYHLRPEAIESVFIMYRTTGDPIWREKGWGMFEAIRNVTRTRYGHAALSNVMDAKEDVQRIDKMESFWLSETLKYFYLLFAEPTLVSLDDWVFNTEAHPFRLQDKFRGG